MHNDEKMMTRLRTIHGIMSDLHIANKQTGKNRKFMRSSIRKSFKEYYFKQIQEPDFPIDIVVTWVDGSDPAWLAEKAKYSPKNAHVSDNHSSRYRDWDLMKYWFRAIEKNAPWVNKVFFVTWGHVPAWLNTDCPKLRIIRHEEIIPAEYRPTFNSHTIEWCLWRIPDLSEHFIYLNDDVFITKPVKKSDFFVDGLPCYCAIAEPVRLGHSMSAHDYARLNSTGIINSFYDIRQCITDYPTKWFNYRYREGVELNVRAYLDGMIGGMFFSHLGVPFRKSAIQEFYQKYTDKVDTTCSHRIRSPGDIMHQAVQMMEMARGSFEPVARNHFGASFGRIASSVDDAVNAIKKHSFKMICINDNETIDEAQADEIKHRIQAAFEAVYSERSAFEKV